MPPIKKKEPQTDDEKYQQQLQFEQDLGRLQRQYMVLERHRHQFSQGEIFAKQTRVLNIFRKEHVNISADLAVASAPAKKKEDARLSDHLNHLLEEHDEYSDKVEALKTYLEEIDGQIKMTQKQVLRLKAKQITDRQFEERVWLARKTLEGLENKLEVQVKKFCTICSENRLMREEINHRLLERQNFLKHFDKLIHKLTKGKQYMLDIIEQATIAYDQREDWCSRLQALRIKGHSDLVHHTQEMRELQRRQDNNRELAHFFGKKGQKRVMRDLEQREHAKRMEQKQKMQEKLNKYQSMMNEITEFSNEANVNVIARKYRVQEDENFTLFKYINDSIGEMERVNDKLGLLHLDIDEKQAIHAARADRQRQRLEELEEQLARAQAQANDADEDLKMTDQKLENMMQGIWGLIKICKCNTDPLMALLGDHTKIHDFNVKLFMEILENKVMELLLKAGYRDKTMLDKKKITVNQKVITDLQTNPTLYGLEKIAESSPCPLCVEHEMVSDVIDTLQHVLSRDEAKERLQERLELPDGIAKVHNVSACHLPKSRQIIQKRYQ